MLTCLKVTITRKLPKFSLTSSRAFSCCRCLFATYYETLKINPTANAKEIKDAYYKLSKENHPDLNPNDPTCHERFILLQEAYRVLSNPEERKLYDNKISRRGPTYYNNSGRPYHPDYTARDEWIRKQNERFARETNYGSHFGRRPDDPRGFNEYYSRPHNMTPEEMQRFFRRKLQLTFSNPATIFSLLGFIVVLMLLIESSVMRNYRQKSFEDKLKHNKIILERYRDPFDPRFSNTFHAADKINDFMDIEEKRRPRF